MIAAEPSAWVTIAVAFIGAVSLITVALIGVMFRVNAASDDKQNNDHRDNRKILLTLQTAVIDLQQDMRQQKSDILEIANSSRARDIAQAQAAQDLIATAQQLKSELAESAKTLREVGMAEVKVMSDVLLKTAERPAPSKTAKRPAPSKTTKPRKKI